jgi:hypothetical protein
LFGIWPERGQSEIFESINSVDRGVPAPINPRNTKGDFQPWNYLFVDIAVRKRKAKSQ